MSDSPVVGVVNKLWGRDRGGVEAVVHAQVCDLSRRGFRVKLLACRPPGSAPRPFPAGVEGVELRAPVIASMPVTPAVVPALRSFARGCDVLHFHLPFPLAEAAALSLPKRTPWLATLHAEVTGRRPWIACVQQWATQRMLQRMDAVLVSSASTSQCRTLTAWQDRIQVLPFGFDLEPFLRVSLQRRLRREPVVAFLGRLVPYKAVDVLLHAAVRLRAQVHIIGDGRERRRLEQLARHLGLGARAHFFGHVPDAELPQRLFEADVLTLPSRSPAEAFGVAQVEAMAAGLPVVNTALATGTDWVSPHGVTGLTVAPEDPVALAAALQRLLEDRPFRLACGRRARQRARALFSAEQRGPELAALYERLLRRPQRAAAGL